MRRPFSITLPHGTSLTLGQRTLIVGVLNVTPDSFSDGGLHLDPLKAIDRALQMESEGADIVEVGGESTRPGARRLDQSEELDRVMPVLKAIVSRLNVPVSIDTYKSGVAEVAVDAGVSIVNDVSALRFDPAVADVTARTGAALVLMHMRGTPETMQKLEPSPDILPEIERELSRSIVVAEKRGVKREQIILDPGIGFGKTLEQNLEILNRLEEFDRLGLPIMIGTSRKSFIGRLTGNPEDQRLFGTAASITAAILRGAHFIRVHDVKEMAEVARVSDAIAAQE
jgi:dihydropteroate synthase